MVLRSIIRIIKALQPPASVDPKVVYPKLSSRARSCAPRRSSERSRAGGRPARAPTRAAAPPSAALSIAT